MLPTKTPTQPPDVAPVPECIQEIPTNIQIRSFDTGPTAPPSEETIHGITVIASKLLCRPEPTSSTMLQEPSTFLISQPTPNPSPACVRSSQPQECIRSPLAKASMPQLLNCTAPESWPIRSIQQVSPTPMNTTLES